MDVRGFYEELRKEEWKSIELKEFGITAHYKEELVDDLKEKLKEQGVEVSRDIKNFLLKKALNGLVARALSLYMYREINGEEVNAVIEIAKVDGYDRKVVIAYDTDKKSLYCRLLKTELKEGLYFLTNKNVYSLSLSEKGETMSSINTLILLGEILVVPRTVLGQILGDVSDSIDNLIQNLEGLEAIFEANENIRSKILKGKGREIPEDFDPFGTYT